MGDLEVFGRLVIPTEVEDAVEATLKKWMGTYLRRVERQLALGQGQIPNPRSYVVTSDFDHFPEEQLPALLLISPGLLERPLMEGGKTYRATWGIRLGVFVEAKDRRSTERLARYYISALRELVAHKGSLGNFAIASSWLHEEYECHVSDRSQRTIGTAEAQFAVEVREVTRRLVGPAEPIEVAPGALPQVTKPTAISLGPVAGDVESGELFPDDETFPEDSSFPGGLAQKR